MGLMNSDQSYSGLIEKYIGTAYDKVKSVSGHLSEIDTVAGIATDVITVAGIAGDISTVKDDIEGFHNIYYGSLANEPTTRPDGSASVEGDLYYNSTVNQLYNYVEDSWVPMGAVKNTVEVIPVTSGHFTGDVATITLSNSYIPNSNNLTVFVNATYQYSIANGGGIGAYNEVNSNTIEFPDGALAVGDEVTCIVGSIASTVNPNISVTRKYYKTSAPNEQIIVIPDAVTYAPGAGNLEVYVDGLLQYVGTNYSETNSTTVTFNDPLTLGTEIIFKKGDIVSNIPTPDVDMETLNVATDFFVNNSLLQTDRVYYLKGYNTIGDGGHGYFYYNSAKARTAANGGTIIDSSVSLVNQGAGTGNGCWMRLYSEAINVKWFGAYGSGTEPDSTAINKAIIAGSSIFFPEGVYKVNSAITLPTGKVFVIPAGAKLKPDNTIIVTLNGGIIAGNYQIFDESASGVFTLSLANKEVLPKWFGSSTNIHTITDGDATPSVQKGSIFKTANTAPVTITTFDNGFEGQVIKVLVNDANTTIDFTASSLKGNVGVDWTPASGDHMTCFYDGTNWYCDISDNTA